MSVLNPFNFPAATAAGLLILSLAGCSDDTIQYDHDTALSGVDDDGGNSDVPGVDAMITPDAETDHAELDAANNVVDGGPDDDAGLRIGNDPRGPLPSEDWQASYGSCTQVFGSSSINQPFEIPNRVQTSPRKLTASEFLTGISGFRYSYSLRPDERHQGVSGTVPLVLFANEGDDVEFSWYVHHKRTPDELARTRASMTFMVNYEPTVAEYTRWDSTRSQILETNVDTGQNFTFEAQTEIWDVRIPADQFDGPGAHDIAFAWESAIDGYGATTGRIHRKTLYYGGYERQTRFCARPQLGADENPWEYWTSRYHMRSNLIAFMHPGQPFRAVDFEDRPTRAPGVTERVYWSLFRWNSERRRYIVSVPLLNGRPVGDPIWSTTGGEERANLSKEQTVDDRGYLDVTLPDEPGLVQIMMATWPDPFVPAETLDGARIEGVQWGGFVSDNSNFVEIVVEDP